MILLVDNYDSFTYNVYQVMSALGAKVEVRRNDELDLEDVETLRPRGIVLSPGPGGPDDAGISCRLLSQYNEVPVLGVCLGHQCVGAAFGGVVVRAPEIRHGKTSQVYHRGQGVFTGIPSPFEAVRYHSLAVDPRSLPTCLEITAQTADGVIMGIRHRERDVEGVQFHPESILTRHGPQLLRNYLVRCGEISETPGALSSG